VNVETVDDQKNIERILFKLKKKKFNSKALYILHNFKHAESIEEINKLKLHQIKGNLLILKNLIEINGCENIIQHSQIKNLETCVEEKDNIRIEHLIMAKEGS
jgi:hypothetical protein